MRRAHKKDAATEGKFFFRSNVDSAQSSPEGGAGGEIYSPCDNDPQSGIEEMTVLQILEGKVRYKGWFGCFACVLLPDMLHACLDYWGLVYRLDYMVLVDTYSVYAIGATLLGIIGDKILKSVMIVCYGSI